MKQKTAISFDMDGTIIDASASIINTARKAMRQFGVEPDASDDMLHLIGPPITDTFSGYYGLSEEMARNITAAYRDMYGKGGMYEYAVYEGIPELIQAIHAQGRKVLLATSKPEKFARKILERIGIIDYFSGIGGPALTGNHTKADMIRMAMAQAQVEDPSAAVQVGDRYFDIDGAREAGIDSIGVLYGFGTKEELENAGATAIAADVQELGRMLGAWN